jgi:hypothetical protein
MLLQAAFALLGTSIVLLVQQHHQLKRKHSEAEAPAAPRAVPPHKRQRSESTQESGVLVHKELFDKVFAYYGFGDFLSVATVCKSWKQEYDLATFQHFFGVGFGKYHMHYRCTTYKTVFSSCGLTRLAHESWALNLLCPKVQLGAGRYGSTDVLLLAHELGMPMSDAVLTGAALAGSVSKLRWLCTEQHCQLPDDICASAAKSGCVDLLRWLQQRGAAFSAGTSLSAAQSAQLQVLQFLHAQGCAIAPIDVCQAAAIRGDLPMLQFLHSIGHLTTHGAVLIFAAQHGSVELMQWLQQHGAAVNDITMLYAVIHGHLLLCRHLLAAGCAFTPDAVQAAASRLEVLQWAVLEGAQLHVGVLRAAVWQKWGCVKLDVCRYLRSVGCPWDDTVVGRDIAAVRWLIETGCPWSHRRSGIAASQAVDGIGVLHYLQQQGAVWSAADLSDMLQAAGTHFRKDIRQFLRLKGAQWPAVLRYEGRPWLEDAVAWARAEGCTSPLQ